MARKNGVNFLGRVPIDTVLVGLLDAVSKGDVPATGVTDTGSSAEDAVGAAAGTNGHSTGEDFPLLERYTQTTSAKVWADIARGVVEGIESRRRTIQERLAPSLSELEIK